MLARKKAEEFARRARSGAWGRYLSLRVRTEP